MKRKWLGLAWGLAAFVPLVFISTPILAFQIGVVFLLCAMFLWPASWIANQFGVVPLTTPYAAIAAIYCGVIGAAIATMLPRLLNLPEQIGRGRAEPLRTFANRCSPGSSTRRISSHSGRLREC